MQAKIALTSASSFTALWIAEALHGAGWDVHALCQSPRAAYTGLRGRRVALLEKRARVHYEVGVDDGGIARWIEANRPEFWIHHHHFMEDFRSPKYDLERARRFGLDPLPAQLDALERVGCRGIVFSGSYFEPGEGGTPENDPTATPYSRSKREVWLGLREECRKRLIPLSKVVIPNPIGPFENEDRLIPKLIEAARSQTPFPLLAPKATGDQLPVTVLADRYLEAAEELVHGRARVLRPSGWVVSVEEFTNAINEELIRKRLGLTPAPLEIGANPAPARSQRNSEPLEIDWAAAWEHYAHWYRGCNRPPS